MNCVKSGLHQASEPHSWCHDEEVMLEMSVFLIFLWWPISVVNSGDTTFPCTRHTLTLQNTPLVMQNANHMQFSQNFNIFQNPMMLCLSEIVERMTLLRVYTQINDVMKGFCL